MVFTEEEQQHLHALLVRHGPDTIREAIDQYEQWRMYSVHRDETAVLRRDLQIIPERQSMSSVTTFSSLGGSSIESATSSAITTDTSHSISRPHVAPIVSESKTRAYFCTYHEELDLPPPFFVKKGDCKTHMKSFHNLDKEWLCQKCHLIFDREPDFVKHHRHEHPRQPIPNVVTELLPKQVFACGFRGCESLFLTWDQWFNHIARHMQEGRLPPDWSFTVVITNLLQQSDLRNHWKNLLLCTYGGEQPLLKWSPTTARQLCQKLERRDFRPSIPFLVQTAHHLGRLASVPIDAGAGQSMQVCLFTPSRDSVPACRDSNELDHILKRPPAAIAPSTTAFNDPPSPYHPGNFERHRAAPHPFDPPELGSTPGPSNFDQSRGASSHTSPSFQEYDVSRMDQFLDFSTMTFGEWLEELPLSPRRFDYPLQPQRQRISNSPDAADARDPLQVHPRKQFNYSDFSNFAKDQAPRPRTSESLIRRVRSSVSLTSRKSQSSLEFDPAQLVPPVPPVPTTDGTLLSRPRSSSQRSRLSRRSGQSSNTGY